MSVSALTSCSPVVKKTRPVGRRAAEREAVGRVEAAVAAVRAGRDQRRLPTERS
jgi:hypothetical protein